jgi:hypothetical protein
MDFLGSDRWGRCLRHVRFKGDLKKGIFRNHFIVFDDPDQAFCLYPNESADDPGKGKTLSQGILRIFSIVKLPEGISRKLLFDNVDIICYYNI